MSIKENCLNPNSIHQNHEKMEIGTSNHQKISSTDEMSPISKLNRDCFEDLFDYLPLTDLLSVGGTNQRLHQLAGCFFQKKCKFLPIYVKSSGFCLGQCGSEKVSVFGAFIKGVHIGFHSFGDNDELTDSFGYLQSKQPQSLKSIEFQNILLTAHHIKFTNDFFNGIEYVKLNKCEIAGEAHEMLFSLCANMKHLCVIEGAYKDGSSLIGTSNQWLLQRYPRLENVILNPNHNLQINELKTFLEINSMILRFSIDSNFLIANEGAFNTNSLDILAVKFDRRANLELCFNKLNELHARGFHKRLHVDCSDCILSQSDVDRMASIAGFVKLTVTMYRPDPQQTITFGNLQKLEQLDIIRTRITDSNNLANKLINLQRLVLSDALPEDIFNFTSRSVKLNTIVVCCDSFHFSPNLILDLSALNKQRAQLAGAHKINIYVREKIYLATKWAMKQTMFEFIEMKRIESHNWHDDLNFCEIQFLYWNFEGEAFWALNWYQIGLILWPITD